jgi:hypothetical protein
MVAFVNGGWKIAAVKFIVLGQLLLLIIAV